MKVLPFILSLLLSCNANAEKTLRHFVSRGSINAELNRLSRQVEDIYGKQEIQFDTGIQPPFVDDSNSRISNLNKQYSDLLFEGDIRVSSSHLRRLLRSKRGSRQAIRGWSNKWPGGRVPYSYHPSISSYKKRAIEESIAFWQHETCIDFQLRTKENVYLHFVGHDEGCWSTVGRDPAQKEQWISIGDGCEPLGISSHEIAHALGLFHEQSRFDRDDHITLITSRIPRNLLYNFAKASSRDISTYNLPYDMGSVMHYSPVEFSNQRNEPSLMAKDSNLQQTMGSLEGPSFLDVLILNEHYQCHKKCTITLNCKNGGFINSRDCSKCKCPTGFTGDLCEKEDYGNTPFCGGELMAENEEKELTISVINGYKCIYHIKAPEGRKISILLKTSLLSTMLGMMNSPSDAVEFYATNPGKSVQQLSAEDTKTFTSPKDKPLTSYTPDGRMVVDGKVVEGKGASTLWTGVLLRSAVSHMPRLNTEKKETKEETENEEEEKKEEITPVNEAIITTAPIQSQIIDEVA